MLRSLFRYTGVQSQKCFHCKRYIRRKTNHRLVLPNVRLYLRVYLQFNTVKNCRYSKCQMCSVVFASGSNMAADLGAPVPWHRLGLVRFGCSVENWLEAWRQACFLFVFLEIKIEYMVPQKRDTERGGLSQIEHAKS